MVFWPHSKPFGHSPLGTSKPPRSQRHERKRRAAAVAAASATAKATSTATAAATATATTAATATATANVLVLTLLLRVLLPLLLLLLRLLPPMLTLLLLLLPCAITVKWRWSGNSLVGKLFFRAKVPEQRISRPTVSCLVFFLSHTNFLYFSHQLWRRDRNFSRPTTFPTNDFPDQRRFPVLLLLSSSSCDGCCYCYCYCPNKRLGQKLNHTPLLMLLVLLM